MRTHRKTPRVNTNQLAASSISLRKSDNNSRINIFDISPVATQFRKWQAMADQRKMKSHSIELMNYPIQMSSSSLPVQLAPVKTAGGEWDAPKYEAWGPSRPDFMSPWGVGAEIFLSFMPGKGSPKGSKIGLIQSLKAVHNGKADPTGSEAVPLDKEGRGIDRDAGGLGRRTTSPVYGVDNTKTSKAKKLTDNVPKSGDNKYGIRNRVGANKPATLWDKPSSEIRDGEISKTFETTAVVLEGKHKGTYLGSVGWGYKRPDGAKKPALEPAALTMLSFGNPTEDFLTAARSWNEAGQNAEGDDLVKVPIP